MVPFEYFPISNIGTPFISNILITTNIYAIGVNNLLILSRAHLSMKECNLFCSYEIHQIGMLQIVFLVSLESFRWVGVHGLDSMMF
jgi:hypothetical protein